jgi:hypothetical protein
MLFLNVPSANGAMATRQVWALSTFDHNVVVRNRCNTFLALKHFKSRGPVHPHKLLVAVRKDTVLRRDNSAITVHVSDSLKVLDSDELGLYSAGLGHSFFNHSK